MAAKRVYSFAIAMFCLTACGTTPSTSTALPGDGTVPIATPSTDMYATGVDPASLGSTSTTSGAALDPTATGTAATAGYTLKGIVTDQLGAPLSGAKVSIGAQTTLSSAQGTFQIDKIMDSQIAVTVSLDGYQSVSNFTVNFSATSTVADKEFKLAASGNTTGGNTSSPTPSSAGFTLNATFSPKTFTSVSAMAVDGDTAYVLGVVDNLLIDRNSVCEINARTGEEIATFSKTGFLSWLPKTADSLALANGQVNVSDGKTTWVFATTGSLVQKTTGVRKPNPTTVTDTARKIVYTLKGGTKCEARTASAVTTFDLPDAQSSKAIGLGSDGDVLVLDATRKAVMQYSFTP
ncbi:MAG: hypothetical protein JWM80_2303 [Cyanobacteria bacterium RYN_339]|nr:hypothetical protein [Cyanobacteria bacterium RYN_339]